MTVFELTSTIFDAAHDPLVQGMVLSFNPSMIEHRAVVTGELGDSHIGMGVLSEICRALNYFSDMKKLQRGIEPSGRKPAILPGQKLAEEPKVSENPTSQDEKPQSLYDLSKDVLIAIADNYSIDFK